MNGAIAQLVERLHGMQEVGGSIPPGSTIFLSENKEKNGDFRDFGNFIHTQPRKKLSIACFALAKYLGSNGA